MYEQREVVLIPFPYSDLTGFKQRPALVLSNKKLNRSRDRLCCLITSNAPIDGLEIKKGSLEFGVLPFQSWVKSYRLFAVHEKIIRKSLCKVTIAFHEQVLKSLMSYLDAEA